MKIELSQEEVDQIHNWYASASDESATDRTDLMFALLEKLGIQATEQDLYPPNPDHWREPAKTEMIAKCAAIKAYRERHPEIKDDDV